MAMEAVARVAGDCDFDQGIVERIADCNTTEAVLNLLSDDPKGFEMWKQVERRVSALVHKRLSAVEKVEVRLFSMNGTPLGEASS